MQGSGPLAPQMLDEIAGALTQYDRRLRPASCTRLIIELAGLQNPGAELRRLYIGIAALALIAAAALPDDEQRVG